MADRNAYLGMVIATGNLGDLLRPALPSRDVVLAMTIDTAERSERAGRQLVNEYGKPVSRRQARRYNYR